MIKYYAGQFEPYIVVELEDEVEHKLFNQHRNIFEEYILNNNEEFECVKALDNLLYGYFTGFKARQKYAGGRHAYSAFCIGITAGGLIGSALTATVLYLLMR